MYNGFHLECFCNVCKNKLSGVVQGRGCHLELVLEPCKTCKIQSDNLKQKILDSIISPEQQKIDKDIIECKIKEAYNRGLSASIDEKFNFVEKDLGGK